MKKCLLLALAGTMLLCAGCGNQEQEPVATENTGDSQAVAETEETETEESEVAEEGMTETESEGDSAETETEEAAYAEILSDGELKDYTNCIVLDNAAFELYSYVESLAEDYTETVNSLATTLDGTADVYSIIIPTSTGITFPDNRRDEINSSDERTSLDKLFSQMQDNVHVVDVYDNLMKHRTEYVYFRTDHHWTALGAYYAYEEFCAVKGIEPEAITDYETAEFDGFIGSLYSATEDSGLKENPDTVVAYYPNCEHEMTVTTTDDTTYSCKAIYDVSNSKSGVKYSAFIAGDNPYSVIENKELSDGSACIIIKDSFGNAFTPFLVDHYQYVYVIDSRYWGGTISELVQETGASDVIVFNNISTTRNKYEIGKLKSVCK
jgi:hypothetical protein